MAQIINDPGQAGYWGQAAASGLGNLLQGLAQQRAQGIQTDRQRTLFNRLYPDNPEFADLLTQFQAHPKIQQSLMANLQKQQQDMQQKRALADYYESVGLPRDLVNQPDWIQKEEIKKTRSPKGGGSWGDKLSSYGAGDRPGGIAANLVTPTEVPEGHAPQTGQFTPQQAQKLREQGYEVPLANLPTSLGQRLSSGALGYGAGVLGLPADLVQVAGNILSSPLVPSGPLGTILRENNLTDYLPTSENIKSGVQALTKGTAAEKYTKPQSSTQKWYEDMGRIVSYLTSPTKALTKGGIVGAAKNLLGGASAAVAGDVAGWMAEDITGSKLLGDTLKNGIWMAYNLFPGTLGQVGRKEYKEFENSVLKPAEKAGKTIDLSKYKNQFREIEKDVNKLVRTSEAYGYASNELVPFQDALAHRYQDPKGWWEFVKEFKKKAANIPERAQQAQPYLKRAANLGEKIMEDFSKTISPSGTQHLKNANRLWRESWSAANAFKEMRDAVTKNGGVGVALWLSGGVRKLLTGAAGLATANYIRKVIADPTMRKYMSSIATASAQKNTKLIDTLLKKMNTRAEKINPREARLVMEQLNKKENR